MMQIKPVIEEFIKSIYALFVGKIIYSPKISTITSYLHKNLINSSRS